MTGVLEAPVGDVSFLRAQVSDGLLRFVREHPGMRLHGEQSFRPSAVELEQAGLLANDTNERDFASVWVLPPRQRMEARATLVEAIERCKPGGWVVASVANNEGARSIESDFTELVGRVSDASKHKCRVFWTQVSPERLDRALMTTWREEAAPRRIVEGRFTSRPGVFAWDRIDAASELLAEHLPRDLAGRGADLGAGWGYLSHEVLARCSGVVGMDLYEAEARALELARVNVPARPGVTVRYHWHDVTAGLWDTYDFVVSNPPFHTGHADQPDLGRAFIASAARALKSDGRLFLVANRHLPYEAILGEQFRTVRQVAVASGFKVIEAVK